MKKFKGTLTTLEILQQYAIEDLKTLKTHSFMMISDMKQGAISIEIIEKKITVSTNKNGETILETTSELEFILFLMSSYTVDEA